MEFFGLIHKRPGYDPFFAENPFSPADELVFMGLVARSCHFDVTACAEARRLAQRAERPLRGLSALWASRRASRAGWKTILLFLKVLFFQRACRVILVPPKHVLHLVWSPYVIYTAIRTALKVACKARILGKRRSISKNKKIKFWNGTKRKICFTHL